MTMTDLIETTEFIDEVTPSSYMAYPAHKALADAVMERYGLAPSDVAGMTFTARSVIIDIRRIEDWTQDAEPYRTFEPS